ncbi:MAG: LacI family DNA-binding transcriptional regulator [Anaerolineaceae bacterium]|nr:LacI family DNA-binding transcriptional regulator [Anaerolineaceae bacterium]
MVSEHKNRLVIKDIAKMCNVSPQTVSRVLNQRCDVSPETRNRIERVIAETGYQPSFLARSLVNHRRNKGIQKVDWLNSAVEVGYQSLKMQVLQNSTWVMIGDSITACDRDPMNHADLGKGYVSFVDGLITACWPSNHVCVLNRGIPGGTIREMKSRWQEDVLELQPDWLSICVGFNDVWQQFNSHHKGQPHVTLDEYEKTLNELLITIKPILKGLVLMTPYLILPQSEPMRVMMDKFGEAVNRLAQRHQTLFVDTQSIFDMAVQHGSIEELTWDGVHLTIPGHMILARAVLQSVGLDLS